MPLGGILSIASAIVGLAFLTVAVTHTQTATILRNIFDGFAGTLKAAMGNA